MEGGVLNMGEENLFNRGTLSLPIVKRKKNLKVKAREAAGIVANLRTQVKELEKQRDFLITWKADMCTGVNVEGTHVDVEFQGLDGDHVHAHKAILASKSNEFQTMFRSNTTQGKMIYNLDMPYEALKAFIDFFYTGIVGFDIIVNHLSTLLNAAHKYNVPFLANVCEDMLVKRMTKDNVITTFDIVKKHCSRNCKEAVLEKASRLGDLSRFKEYNVFTQSNPGLLLELYEQLTNQSEQSPSKKQKLSQDNVKSETDEDESIDDEVRIETNPMARPYMQINGVSQYGTPMYWHGTPILSHPFHPIGFDGASYPHPQGQRPPSYDVPIMPRSPYDIPSFVPPMFPRGFLKGANIPSPGPPKTPFSEEMFSCKSKANRQEDIKRSKLPLKQQKRCLLRGVKTTHNKNKKFIATITIKGQHIILGKCHTEEEAGRLYDRAAFVIGRKTNNELPDDTKEELKGISWDDFMASLQEVTALEKIHQEKLGSEDLNEVDYSEDQGEDQMQEQEQVLSDISDHSSPAC